MPPRGRRRGVKRGGGTAASANTESDVQEPGATSDSAGSEATEAGTGSGTISIDVNVEGGEMSLSGVMDEDLVVLDETGEDDAENNLEKKQVDKVTDDKTEKNMDSMDTSTAATEPGVEAGNEEKSEDQAMSVGIATVEENTVTEGKVAEGGSELPQEMEEMDSTDNAAITQESVPVEAVSASSEKLDTEQVADVEMEEKSVIVIEDDKPTVTLDTNQKQNIVASDMKKTGEIEASTSAAVSNAGGTEVKKTEKIVIKSEVDQPGDEKVASTSAADQSMEEPGEKLQEASPDTAIPHTKLNGNETQSNNKDVNTSKDGSVATPPVVNQESKLVESPIGEAKEGQQKKQEGKQAVGDNQNKANSTGDKPAPFYDYYVALPKSFLKLKQLTVNIGPLRQLDLMSRELHDILKLSDEFNISFELKEKKLEDGTTKKEKCGFVRVPFKMRSPAVLVMVAQKLGSLRIDGRDMSVKFPDVFNNAINDCKEYVKQKKEKQNENKKKRKEIKQRQILVEGVPDIVDEETMKAEFPEAVKFFINKTTGTDGTQKVKFVLMDFTTKEDCLKVFRDKKGCKIGEKKVFLKYNGSEIQSPAPKNQAKSAKSSRGKFNQGRLNFGARGRGMAATGRSGSQYRAGGSSSMATNKGGNRGFMTGNRGFGRGILGLSRGSVNRALHSGQGGANTSIGATASAPSAVQNISQLTGMSGGSKKSRNRKKRNSGNYTSQGNISSLSNQNLARQMSGGVQSGWAQQSLTSPFLSPTQSQYSRSDPTRDMSGRSINQSPGRTRTDRSRTDDNDDPVALMQYLKTRLEKMEEKMTGGDLDKDRSYNKGGGRDRSPRAGYDDMGADSQYSDNRGYRNNQGGSRWQDDYSSSNRDSGQRNWNNGGSQSNMGQGGNQQNRGQNRRGKKRKSDNFGGIDAKKQQSNFGQSQQTASYFGGGGSGYKSMADQNTGYRQQMSQWGSSASSNQPLTQFGVSSAPIQQLSYPMSQQGMTGTSSIMGYDYSGMGAMGSSSFGQGANMSSYSQGQGSLSGYSQGQTRQTRWN